VADANHTYKEVTHSKQRRCEGWDYKGRGIYMLTFVVRDRQPLLCKIEGNEYDVRTELTEIGSIVLEATTRISELYPQIRILCKQIMPDHLHLLLFVEESLPVHLTSVVSGFKIGCNRKYWTSLAKLADTEQRGEEPPLQAAVSCTADFCEAEKTDTKTRTGLWEDGYHDRILFHKGQLDTLIHYIKDNPRRFVLKRANPELFKIRQHLQIAGMFFTAMGNIFLADYPQKAVVQCSRKLHQAEIDAQKTACLNEAANGVLFVSAAISEGEKQICRALREAGHPLVILLEKGFPKPEDQNYKYFKPHGMYFEACAAGKLLLLEPAKEVYEQAEIEANVKAKIGDIPHEALRYRFLALNAIAERICTEEGEDSLAELADTEQRGEEYIEISEYR